MKTYQGIKQNQGMGGQVITIKEGDETRILKLSPSLRLRNHSPDGFNWGYGGSGPAQTALAILFDVTGDEEVSQRNYQQFKWDFVAYWGVVWKMTEGEIREWLEKQDKELVNA